LNENDFGRLAALAAESGIIPEGKIEEFLRCLKQRDFSWLVTDPSTQEQRLQGDVFDRIPIFLLNPEGKLLCREVRAMVLNSACDLEPRRSEILTFAPVQSFQKFAKTMEGQDKVHARSFLESVRTNEVNELLYLPSCPQLSSDAVVYLNQMNLVPGVEYEKALDEKRRVASLTDNGYYFLLMKLTRFFVRPQR
jgi:hypothetical protein